MVYQPPSVLGYRTQWDDVLLRFEMENRIAEQIGTDNGILTFAPLAFPKSGKGSFGVTLQWCNRLGKIDNCQIGEFMVYASRKGHALVDGDLYLLKESIKDKVRLNKAGVPKHKQKYQTRPAMYLELQKLHAD